MAKKPVKNSSVPKKPSKIEMVLGDAGQPPYDAYSIEYPRNKRGYIVVVPVGTSATEVRKIVDMMFGARCKFTPIDLLFLSWVTPPALPKIVVNDDEFGE